MFSSLNDKTGLEYYDVEKIFVITIWGAVD